MKNISIFFFLVIFGFGCEEVIDWPVASDEIRLVIEGRITNEYKAHRIKLTETADYFNPADPVPVENARISLSDGTNTVDLAEIASGIYESEPFSGEVGKTYTLSVNLSSPLAGETSFNASSTMLAPPILDSLAAINDVEDDDGEPYFFTRLAFWGTGNLEIENGYLMEVYVNNQFETDTIDEVLAFTDEFLAEEFENFEFYYIEEPAASENDSITLVMHTVEEEFIDFHSQILIESEPRDPFGLSSPPANLISNFSGDALGYFYASAVDTISTVVRDDL